jgi:hypothetical protein
MLHGNQMKLSNLTFFELFEELGFYKEKIKPVVYVECGFLNKSNGIKFGGSSAVNAKIGERTEPNFETTKIIEMCDWVHSS